MKRSQSFQSFLQSANRPSSPPPLPPSLDFPLSQTLLSPPLYGRPYRLPPSPSFTELLKPQWRLAGGASPREGTSPISAITTPESSDDESTIARASEFAQHQSGKNNVGAVVGLNEFYGFALYLGSTVALSSYS